jgi:hypothetical protein
MTEPTTTHTTIPNSELAIDAPARSINALQLRDNNTFVREGQGQFVYFTADGTYTVPASLSRVRVTVVGGGGGGGGASGSAGGGGGAAIESLEKVTIGSSVTVTVGAGGTTTVTGGTSSFGAFCSATGGVGGAASGAGGLGGTGSGGDVNFSGQPGGPAGGVPAGGVSGAGIAGIGGRGSVESGADGIVIIEEYY